MGFLGYEYSQFQKEGYNYLYDFWNYFEVIGIFLTFIANCIDIVSDEISDLNRVLFVLSMLFCLVKVLFLIRVSRQMSFLVMMVIQVIIDVKYFMVLFMIFIFIFA